jgi:hypothetical protein
LPLLQTYDQFINQLPATCNVIYSLPFVMHQLLEVTEACKQSCCV